MARLLVALVALAQTVMAAEIQEFFPDVKSNLTQIKWAHAVNNQARLTQVLQSNVSMIEADVVMGTLTNSSPNSTTLIPVMAHPPSTESDLSLEKFLEQVIKDKKKGIKLDFKSIDAAESGINAIVNSTLIQNLTVPLWLNADILKGPLNSTEEPVNATRFLAATTKLPQALLSIGWTTSRNETSHNAATSSYTNEQLKEMQKTIVDNKVTQSVTYPVRACFAANDVAGLKQLLDDTKANKPTLTVWSADNDIVDAANLSKVIKSIGIDKVFVDVPESLWKQMDLSNAGLSIKSSSNVLLATMLVALSAIKLL